MEQTLTKQPKRLKPTNKKKIGIVVLCVVGALLLISLGLLIFANVNIASSERVLSGVSFEGVSFAGDTFQQAEEKAGDILEVMLSSGQVDLAVSEGRDISFALVELSVTANRKEAARQIYNTGREGNFFTNGFGYYFRMFGGQDLKAELNIDDQALDRLVKRFSEEYQGEREDASYEIQAEEEELFLAVHTGKDGIKVDEQKLENGLREGILAVTYQGALAGEPVTADGSLEVDACEKITVEQLTREVMKEPKDATWGKDVDGNAVVIAEEDGISFDAEEAQRLLSAHPDEVVTLELTVTKPKINEQWLLNEGFNDVLSEYTSTLANNYKRTQNVALAAKKINNYILMPGETFSFNKVVGPRTYEAGFQDAKIYVKDEMVDGVGGGICQVSSNIYYCTLQAALETVERRNHRFTVSYIPLGYDATVAYGSIDFRFKNNTDNPIKIKASVSGNKLYTALMGIKDPGLKVELSTSTSGKTPFTTREVVDETLQPGERKVTTNGTNGYTTLTYQKVTREGKVVKDEMIHKSVYVPCTQVVHVGPTETQPVDPGTDPGTTDPGTTDPGTTDPGTTDPGITDPGTTDLGTTTEPETPPVPSEEMPGWLQQ